VRTVSSDFTVNQIHIEGFIKYGLRSLPHPQSLLFIRSGLGMETGIGKKFPDHVVATFKTPHFKVEGMAQALQCMPSKCEVLSSNYTTTKKERPHFENNSLLQFP
jgi:hypothetical protein